MVAYATDTVLLAILDTTGLSDGRKRRRVNKEPIVVVGMGADGWEGLGGAAREAVAAADVVFGSARQLGLVPDEVTRAQRCAWPTPLVPALPGLLDEHDRQRVCVLASGDPMFHGIGVTLSDMLGAQRIRVFPQVSAASLACARLGWAVHATPVVNAVAAPLATVVAELADKRRLLVMGPDGQTAGRVATLLVENGFGGSTVTVLEQLGGPGERTVSGVAADWAVPPGDCLNIVAVQCRAEPTTPRLSRLPGLPDEIYGGEGQLTKAELRGLAVLALQPRRGELLWDVGAGSGSIAIEWCRADPSCRAVCFERDEQRQKNIARNAAALGVPGIPVFGEVPEAIFDQFDHFDQKAYPDAVFVGGAVSDRVLEACWRLLRPGGRLVAHAVTAQSEAELVRWRGSHGGRLRRYQIYRAEPLGHYTTWRPSLPVTQWVVTK